MHRQVDTSVDSWLYGMRQQQGFGRFIFLWIAFNQLYNFHCYDLHPECKLNHKLDPDLGPREDGSTPKKDTLYCQNGQNEGRRAVCVVRFLPEEIREKILAREEIDFFLTREVHNPVTGKWIADHGGVLDIYKTKTKSPTAPLYTLGFVSAMERYRAKKIDSVVAIQHLAYLLYTVRCNLMHGGKTYDSQNNREVIENATPLLYKIVTTLKNMHPEDFMDVEVAEIGNNFW